MCLCWKGGLVGALGVDGGKLPLSTRPQRYCDPASFVCICIHVIHDMGGGGWCGYKVWADEMRVSKCGLEC